MIILNLEGVLQSNVRCVIGCGLGKRLDIEDTQGMVGDDIIARLTHVGEYHEQRHPLHKVEVTFYRRTEPLVSSELP